MEEFSRCYALGTKIGEGAFAEVFEATLRGARAGAQPYAVKRTIRRGLGKEDEKGLLEEVRKRMDTRWIFVLTDNTRLRGCCGDGGVVKMLLYHAFVDSRVEYVCMYLPRPKEDDDDHGALYMTAPLLNDRGPAPPRSLELYIYD